MYPMCVLKGKISKKLVCDPSSSISLDFLIFYFLLFPAVSSPVPAGKRFLRDRQTTTTTMQWFPQGHGDEVTGYFRRNFLSAGERRNVWQRGGSDASPVIAIPGRGVAGDRETLHGRGLNVREELIVPTSHK